jgi:hypothetical protein
MLARLLPDTRANYQRAEHLRLRLPHTGVATGAIADYRKGLAITRALVKQSPANTQWQRDVFLSLTKIGDLKAQAGDTTAPTASYGEAVAIARRLAALDPSNPSLRLDLAQGLCKIGDVTLGDADKDARVAYYEEGLEIMRGLVQRDPRNSARQQAFWVSLNRLAISGCLGATATAPQRPMPKG